MGITEDDYHWGLSISPDNDHEIHLKRSTGSSFVNYNSVLMKAWEANLDIPPVNNYFKALTYMTACFPKSESEVSEVRIIETGCKGNQGVNQKITMGPLSPNWESERTQHVRPNVAAGSGGML